MPMEGETYNGICLPRRYWSKAPKGYKTYAKVMWYLLPLGPLLGSILFLFLMLTCLIGVGIALFPYVWPIIKYLFWPFGKLIVKMPVARERKVPVWAHLALVLWFPVVLLPFFAFAILCGILSVLTTPCCLYQSYRLNPFLVLGSLLFPTLLNVVEEKFVFFVPDPLDDDGNRPPTGTWMRVPGTWPVKKTKAAPEPKATPTPTPTPQNMTELEPR